MTEFFVIYDDGESEPLVKSREHGHALTELIWSETSAVSDPANGEPGWAVTKSADTPVTKSGEDIFAAFGRLLRTRR